MFSNLLEGTVILLACQTHNLVPGSEEQELSHRLNKTKTNKQKKIIANEVGMSRIDGYSYTKRFLPYNKSKSDFRILKKNPCPTHLKTEKSNVSSGRNFPLGLRTGYSFKRVLDLPLKAYRTTDVGYTSRYCRR